MVWETPRYFAQIMAELLFWLGPDRILMGSDYAIWNPKWILEEFIKFELPPDIEKEYGVQLTLDVKKKILYENATKLWGIDVNEIMKLNDDIKNNAKVLEVKLSKSQVI